MGAIPSGRRPPLATRADRSFPLLNSAVEDSDWEPDGVTLQVRFCEGGGPRCSPLLSNDTIKGGVTHVGVPGARLRGASTLTAVEIARAIRDIDPTKVPFRSSARTCSKWCAPAGLHRICCFLLMRWLIKWFITDSTCAVEILRPAAFALAKLGTARRVPRTPTCVTLALIPS
jgi:hypothetical protein